MEVVTDLLVVGGGITGLTAYFGLLDLGEPKPGQTVVVSGAEFEAMQARVREKYGFQVTLVNGLHSIQRLLRRGGHASDRAVIVTLDDA